MDLSALIFIALAVAWAAYLIPKALKLHEESAASSHIEGFSDRMRVLARREVVDRRTARLVIPGRPAARVESAPAAEREQAPAPTSPTSPTVTPVAAGRPASPAARRAAARRAAQRRRRVLGTLLLALAVVVGLAVPGILAAWSPAVPGLLIVAWLVTCRVMVRRERGVAAPRSAADTATDAPAAPVVAEPAAAAVAAAEGDLAATDVTGAIDAVAAPEEQSTPAAGWDPVPVTLPTYVAKQPAAPRKVRTIDLDSTGVWSSGRSESDSALVREADASRAAAAEAEEKRRASGS